jgi:hypothetical protein
MATVTEVYSTAGTFQSTRPDRAVSVRMKVIGGGGPGSGKTTTGNGAGGAGGNYAEAEYVLDELDTVIDIIVAATKVGTTGDGGFGNTSKVSINGSDICLATGGQSANDAIPGAGNSAGCIGTIIRQGGNGAAPSTGYSGAGGGAAGDTSNGGNSSNPNGGASGGTNSGAGANSQEDEDLGNGNGFPGNNYGAGGSGACKNTTGSPTGGAGAQGHVTLIYTVLDQGNFFFSI